MVKDLDIAPKDLDIATEDLTTRVDRGKADWKEVDRLDIAMEDLIAEEPATVKDLGIVSKDLTMEDPVVVEDPSIEDNP